MKKIFRRVFSPANMRETLSNSKGFTLIELAIVMVIIGIILGAVLKGQDLINNARTKKFVNAGKSWEMAAWSYLDRKGRFPGDVDKDGKIGDGVTGTNSFKDELIAAKFINPPYEGPTGSEVNRITMGSFTFYVYLGTDAGADAGKNIMMICKAVACDSAFTDDELVYIEAFDVSVDGSADGAAGQMIGVAAAPGAVVPGAAARWEAAYAAPPAAAAWDTTKQVLVYYYDRAR